MSIFVHLLTNFLNDIFQMKNNPNFEKLQNADILINSSVSQPDHEAFSAFLKTRNKVSNQSLKTKKMQ